MSKLLKKQNPTSAIEMDARQLLRTINSGAAAQVGIFQEKISRLGADHGMHLELVSLNPNNLIFEDTDNSKFYQADIHRLKGGKIKLDKVREIRVVESRKKEGFSKVCEDLVNAISEDDNKAVESAFSRIAKQHFRGSVIPQSGWVTTRDGIARHIHVEGSIVPQDTKAQLIHAVCETLADRVVVAKGQIAEAYFSDSSEPVVKIPVNEFMRRRVVARHMKEAALGAYKSEGFQNRIKEIAGYFSNGKIDEAAKKAIGFLKEEQEFSLLNRDECVGLVGDTLATNGYFNDKLARDVGSLIYKVNCKVNRDDIVESWRKTAQKSEYSPLIENARILRDTKSFEEDYDRFLRSVYTEDSSTKDVRVNAYLVALQQIRKVIDEDDDVLVKAIDDYITRLEQDPDDIDDATMYEVEDILSSISQELIQDVRSLADFDEIPEPPDIEPEQFGDQDLSAEPGAAAGSGPGGAVPLPLGEPETEAPEGEEADLELDLTPPEGSEEEEELLAAGVEKATKPISEMDDKDLRVALRHWSSDRDLFAMDDAREHLQAYADRAQAIGESKLVEGFQKILARRIMSEEGLGADPYAYGDETGDVGINKEYGVVEDMICDECGMPMEADAFAEAGERCPYCGACPDPTMEAVGMDAPRGKGVAARGLTKSDGKSSGKAAQSSSGQGIPAEATGEYSGTGVEMGGQDGKGVIGKGSRKVSGRDSSGAPGKGASGQKMDHGGGSGVASKGTKSVPGTDASGGPGGGGGKTEKMDHKGGKGVASRGLNNSDGKSHPGSAPGSSGATADEEQYKFGSKRRPRGYSRSSVAAEGTNADGALDETLDATVAAVMAEMENLGEGGLPSHLEKYKFSKKGKKDDNADDMGEDEDDNDEDGKPFDEDKDITSPSKKGYDTSDAARKDGDGKKRRPLPKFSDTDYDGGKGAKTADQSGSTGYGS